jgi:hypothetical protein
LLVVAALGGVLLAGSSSAAPALTPDQQVVNGLTSTRNASKTALGSLARPTAPRIAKATEEMLRAMAGLEVAAKAAARAVGALETPSVRQALTRAGRLTREARTDIAQGRYSGARAKLQRTITLTGDALADFGRPLEKEFASFAINRDFSYLPEFANYSGVSAKVGEEITEVVIGAADRTTANAGEPGVMAYQSGGLPITRMSVAVISDPIGRFNSGWCDLESGVITCSIRPAMPTDHTFTIAFGPKLPRGTKLLLKFRSAAGERSYSVFATR